MVSKLYLIKLPFILIIGVTQFCYGNSLQRSHLTSAEHNEASIEMDEEPQQKSNVTFHGAVIESMSLSDSVQIEKPINPIILMNPIVPTEPLIHTQPIIPAEPTIHTQIITTPEIVQTILPEIITTSKIKETIMPQTTPEIEETSMPEITTTSEIEKTILPENNKIAEIKNAVLRIQNILDSPDPNEYIREISSTSTTTHAPLYLQVPKIDNDDYIFGIATHLDIPAMESTTIMPPPKENNNPVLPKLSKPTEATIEEFTWWRKALAGVMCALNDCSELERMLKLPPVIHSKGYYEESYMRKML